MVNHISVHFGLINSSYRKRIHADSYDWVEGIGNTKGLFVESWANVSGWLTKLLCMSENDTTWFPSFSVGTCSPTVNLSTIDNESGIQAYPNPTNGMVRLEQENGAVVTVEILDMLGRLLFTKAVTGRTVDLNFSTLQSGIYFIRVQDRAGAISIKKVVKE